MMIMHITSIMSAAIVVVVCSYHYHCVGCLPSPQEGDCLYILTLVFSNTGPYAAAHAVKCYDRLGCSGDYKHAESAHECCTGTDSSSSYEDITGNCMKCVGKVLLSFDVNNNFVC